jgi:hypothetical protein
MRAAIAILRHKGFSSMKKPSKASISSRAPRPSAREHAALLEEVKALRLANERLRDEKYIAHLALFGSHINSNYWLR